MSFICAQGHPAPNGSRPVPVATVVREVAYRIVGGHSFDKRSGRVRSKFERTARGTEIAEVKNFCVLHAPSQDFNPEVLREWDPETEVWVPFKLVEQVLDSAALEAAEAEQTAWLGKNRRRQKNTTEDLSDAEFGALEEEWDDLFE